MKYACFSNWVTYKKVFGKDLYHVRNHVWDTECYLNSEDFMFSRRLNGRLNPYSIRGDRGWHQTKLLLQELEEYGVIRDDHGIIKIDGDGYLITLIRTGNSKAKRSIARFFNALRVFLFIPVLILGLYFYFNYDNSIPVEPVGVAKLAYEHPVITSLSINIFAIILGAFFHEISHGQAARSTRGGRVFEYGMLLSFPPGFYTLTDTRNNSTLQEIGVLLAGVQGNLLFAGIILILGSVLFPYMKPFVAEPAAINIIMACTNLSAFNGTDGIKILAAILGLDLDDLEKTKDMIKDRGYRSLFINDGMTGCVKVAACYILTFLQLFFPMMIVLGIVMWIGVIFL